MGGRAVSPGGALLRTSRMFSIPKPLPEPPSTNLHIGDHKSNTMTRQYPQHQSITSPLSSREKGDWGFKRPFPLKSTMATSTPLIRVKQVDTIENVTNFASAADHSLSLEKFQELRVAMAVPQNTDRRQTGQPTPRTDLWHKSVFEEDMDFTDFQGGRGDDRRWKFQGPWLARMTEGAFVEYLNKKVRPKRAQFRQLLKSKLAEDISAGRRMSAADEGKAAPPSVEARDITEEQFTDYLRSLRNDRVTLYALVSKFLDLAPLGQPVGFLQTFWSNKDIKAAPESPYGKSGPPPSHPSAGISYLRTSSFMENHPIYGPQAKRAPALARVVYPRIGPAPAKLGVGGFVANAPAGDSDFNLRQGMRRGAANKTLLNGIMYLDTTTFGGAKAYVEAQTASVDPSGKVVLQLRETAPEAQLIARENKGLAVVYHDGATKRYVPTETDEDEGALEPLPNPDEWRMDRVTDEILEEGRAEKDIVSSSSSYGLGTPKNDER